MAIEDEAHIGEKSVIIVIEINNSNRFGFLMNDGAVLEGTQLLKYAVTMSLVGIEAMHM